MLSLASTSHRVATSVQCQRGQAFKAFYATIRSLRQQPDFILSILRANPSVRDARGYLASFGPRPQKSKAEQKETSVEPVAETKTTPIIDAILDPVVRRTALVKVQAPFTDVQLESIARGMAYLEKLGLVSVMVVEVDNVRDTQEDRTAVIEEVMRVVSSLERQGSRARPVLGAVARLGPGPHESEDKHDFPPPEAHTIPSDLTPIRSALRAGEIPVIPPFALDSFCRSVRVDANDVIAALARGMAEAAVQDAAAGGIPSYARSGLPHLLVNMSSEYEHITDTFRGTWRHSHPTALANLSLARKCLAYMPPSSSAVMVSHRSPSSLIANLITNKPAVSSSLPHALLQGNRKLTPHTPTLLRRGLPIRVVRSVAEIDQAKMTHLLEKSFVRTLDERKFYGRLEKTLDFVIIAGDYAGAAIVTNEPSPQAPNPISYLDKFATYGLGHPFSVNPNGGKGGQGEGRDLVWRSRANNPVNKWYFERSSGHVRMGSWALFWCDAEKHLKIEQSRRGMAGLSYVEDWEKGRLAYWADVVEKIPSTWK
ncbi:mitochondrial amino-acid acetyltransferase [Hymenopellis radicata]|nr:mitochondrial amino-acid acetyltransferase [Hymenopellis radicata]